MKTIRIRRYPPGYYTGVGITGAGRVRIEDHYTTELNYLRKASNSCGLLISIESFKGNKMHGRCKYFNKDGSLKMVTRYKDGKRHGLEYTYFYLPSPEKMKSDLDIARSRKVDMVVVHLFKDDKLVKFDTMLTFNH